MNLPSSDVYTDFASFAGLRAKARQGGDEARQQVAKQVEGLFMNMMLKSMREAGQAFGDTVGGVEQSMYDSQLALSMSEGGRLGFAKTMFGQPSEPTNLLAGVEQARSFPVPQRNLSMPARDWAAVRSGLAERSEQTAPASNDALSRSAHIDQLDLGAINAPAPAIATDAKWDSPQSFVQQLLPSAKAAADKLGTSAEAVLAVAALETGWGKHMPSKADGTRSNNLFGIKAHGWGGEVTKSSTLEFEHGAFQRRVEPFRAYASAHDAVADFANFISSQPRYHKALQSGGDPVKFVHALQAAGYATDPRYGDKLESLINGPVLQSITSTSTSTSATATEQMST